MSIQGNDGFLDLENASLRVTGNVHAEGLKVGSVRLQPAYSLQSVTNISNTTTQMVQFTNPTKGFDVTSNIEVGDANLFVDTTTGRVGVGTNAPMGTLDVKGVLNHTQTANVAQITSNSNVVMEYRRSKKLIKYPRVYLTSAAQTGSGYEGYIVSQTPATLSGNSNRQAWALFDGVLRDKTGHAGPHFNASGDRYDTSGNYTGGDSLGGVSGDWIYIRLPNKIQLQSVDLWTRYSDMRNPIDATVLGSLNGTNWNVIGSWKNATFTAGESSSFTINSIQYYDYIGFVFEKIEANSNGKYVNIHEIELFGLPEYDPEAHGTDVVLHTTPNVPNTDFSNVYYDGQDYTSMPATVADKSGNGVTGTPSGGVGFDTTYKAFTFDGVDDKITATLTNPAGAWVHSTSMWFKVNSLSAINTLFSIKNNTSGGTDQTPHLVIDTNGERINHAFWGNDIFFGGYGGIVPNKWYHISTTYSGGSDTSSRKMFLNGVELGIASTSGTVGLLNVYANSTLRIGVYPNGTDPFNGSIANFRLYNQALSADEIWELYAYQKEYFEVSPDVVTLKAGRVGIGTSEPRAVLDVRGDIRGGCPVLWTAHRTAGDITSARIIIWDTVVLNKSGGYNPIDGLFTAPISGHYSTSWHFRSNNSGGSINGTVYKNGVSIGWGQTNNNPNTGLDAELQSATVIIYLNVGDTMGIYVSGQLQSGDPGIEGTSFNAFTGFYLST